MLGKDCPKHSGIYSGSFWAVFKPGGSPRSARVPKTTCMLRGCHAAAHLKKLEISLREKQRKHEESSAKTARNTPQFHPGSFQAVFAGRVIFPKLLRMLASIQPSLSWAGRRRGSRSRVFSAVFRHVRAAAAAAAVPRRKKQGKPVRTDHDSGSVLAVFAGGSSFNSSRSSSKSAAQTNQQDQPDHLHASRV